MFDWTARGVAGNGNAEVCKSPGNMQYYYDDDDADDYCYYYWLWHFC